MYGNSPIRVLDLFCGAGGSSYGAKAAGCYIAGGIDAWQIAAATYQTNFPAARVVNRRIEDLTSKELHRTFGEIDLILASPVCTDHTCAKGAAERSEESKRTANEVPRIAKIFQPRWVVIENVVQMKRWQGYAELTSRLNKLGYRLREEILDAADFGVPQSRRRLFLIADREAEPRAIRIPRRRRRAADTILDSADMWVSTPLFSAKRARPTLERAERAIAQLGDEERFLIVYYGSDGSGGWQSLSKPLRTITTLDRFALVETVNGEHRMRMLQVPELKRAMGLGEDFKLGFGSRRDKIKLLGNGVCAPVMSCIVQSLVDPLQNTRHMTMRKKLADLGA